MTKAPSTVRLVICSTLVVGAHLVLAFFALLVAAPYHEYSPDADPLNFSWRWVPVVWLPEIILVVGLLLSVLERDSELQTGVRRIVWVVALVAAIALIPLSYLTHGDVMKGVPMLRNRT